MTMQGHTILVAGGTSGIGRGLAELLCRLGNEVLVFDTQTGVAQAVARANPGMRAIDLDLANPWSVAGFAEQVAATCPTLNMLVDIDIAFPAKHLPGLGALLEDDGGDSKLEAHRLGMQHLAGALLPHLRKQTHSAIFRLSAGPTLVPRHARPRKTLDSPFVESGTPASTLSVRKRWASATIDVADVASLPRAERMRPAAAAHSKGIARTEFISCLAHLLAEGLHEAAALARLRALWPQTAPMTHRTRDDDLVPQAY